MYSRLSSKTVLITGASSGIGRATALEFASHSASLILIARRLPLLESLKNDISSTFPNVKIHLLPIDITNSQLLTDSLRNLPPDFSNINVLVNNAGLVRGLDKTWDVSENDFDEMFNTNVKALWKITSLVVPAMKAKNSGHIVNIGSVSGTQVYPGGSIYCATKHSVDALTRTLRMELVDTNINVISIDPGLVETEFSLVRFNGDEEKVKEWYKGMKPLKGSDVAECISFAVSRDPRVNIANMLVFPTCQAAARIVHREI